MHLKLLSNIYISAHSWRKQIQTNPRHEKGTQLEGRSDKIKIGQIPIALLQKKSTSQNIILFYKHKKELIL